MTNLRQAQKALTRRLLLEAGVEVMGGRGYAATTIDQIASRAGATRATFYLHFSSKADLVSHIVERTDEMLTSTDDPPLPEMVAANDPDMIRAYLRRKFDQWPEIKPYMLITLQAAAEEPDVQAAMDSWYDRAIGALAEGLDATGRFDSGSRRTRCGLAFGQLVFASQRWFRNGWVVDRDVLLEQMTRSWVTLLCEE